MARFLPAVAVLATLLTACQKTEAPTQPPPPDVVVLAVSPQTLPLQKDLVGRLAPFRSADVRARVPGVLQQRVYREGSDVKEGEVLFTIDPAQLRAALGTAQASLAQAQASYANAKTAADRARQLAPQNYISKSDLDNALATERSSAAAVQAGRAAVDAAQINLGYATVRAPISGRAGKQQVTEGALVGQGDTTLLTTVDQIDPLYVNFSMSVSEMEELRRMQIDRSGAARVQVRLQDGTLFDQTGTLDFSGDVVDPTTGAISMRATVPNPGKQLLPGAYVTLLANLGNQSNIYVVPQAAVQRDAASAYVLVVGAGDKVARKDIRLLRSAGSDWIVDQGLASGDRVIVSGLQKATIDGVVTPTTADVKAAASNAPTAPAADAAAAPAEAATAPAAAANGDEAKD